MGRASIELLKALWPEPPADGYLTIWEMPGKTSLHYPLREVLACEEKEVEELLSQLEGHDVYFGHGLRCSGLGQEQRGTKKHVNWVPGYILDIDTYNPDNPKAHKAGNKPNKAGLRLPENDDDVDAILEGAPVPTAIVHTGNGYHVHWGFEKPQQLTCKAGRDAAHKQFEAFQQEFIDRAASLGFHVDKTASVDRVWRWPGSENCKGEKKAPVRLLHSDPSARIPTPDSKYKKAASNRGANAVARKPKGASVPQSTINKLRKLKDPERKKMFDAIFEGKSFSEAGGRDAALQRVCSSLCWADEGKTTIEGLAEFLRPSLQAWADEPDAEKDIDEELAKAIEKLERASGDFARKDAAQKESVSGLRKALIGDASPDGADGEPRFQLTKQGAIKNSAHNIKLALKMEGLTFKKNELTTHIEVVGMPGERTISDSLNNRICVSIDERFDFVVQPPRMLQILDALSHDQRYHPIKNYFASLPAWDGVARLETWLPQYAGCEDTPFNRAVGQTVFVAAVRRILNPGCKFDTMLVLEGPQGCGKSTLLRLMAKRDEWFNDQFPLGASAQISIEQSLGAWVVEIAELSGLRKNQAESVKTSISSQCDRARLAYGRIVSIVPRAFILIGTTNSDSYMRDETGNRRFWPAKIVAPMQLTAFKKDLDQLYAEALVLEKTGFSLVLPSELWQVAAELQAERQAECHYYDSIARRVEGLDNCRITLEAIFEALGTPEGLRASAMTRVASAMKQCGFERVRLQSNGTRHRFFVKGDGETELVPRGPNRSLVPVNRGKGANDG